VRVRLTWEDIQTKAVVFSKRWKDAASEEALGQSFVADFLRVFGVGDPLAVGAFERKVQLADGRKGYIDYLWKGKIAIEMKSRGEDLGQAYLQLQGYMKSLPAAEVPDIWLVCDFAEMRLSRRSTSEFFGFHTSQLRKHVRWFADIAGYEAERAAPEQAEVNVKAAEKMATLHDALKSHGYDGHDLQVYLVRLLFCMFANSTGIFPKGSLITYLSQSREDGGDLSERIAKLFEVLNMSAETRAKRTLLSEELKQFQYINGSLFASALPSADFDGRMRIILAGCLGFDWAKISPAIFGAMFQGVMDKDRRRELGAHYTSEENILKLINPLFLDDLWKDFHKVKTDPKALDGFHAKLAGLRFLDPACGCGNFLIITYRELRRLELEVLKMKVATAQLELDVSSLLKVSVEQFYGIECEDFPCQIAQVGMWLVDHQMNLEASDFFGQYYARLPLTKSATIVHGNALRIDWESVVARGELSYIFGNPPFVGYSNQNAEQKDDILSVYLDENGKPFKNAGKIDYVSAWYYKAAKYLSRTRIRAAFVSTNSITQGEQVSVVWKPLFDMFGISIDFAYRTFKWGNEARGKAAVHCVIVGFSKGCAGEKVIYDDNKKMTANNINPYLVDAPDIFIESRKRPLCDVPEMITGNRPADGGHLLIEDGDLASFLEKDPFSKKFIRRFMGAEEYINNKKRWCLWLVGATPSELRKMPEVVKRIAACKLDRENAPDAGRRKLAGSPMLFREQHNPENFIVIPAVSSERRQYMPMGFMSSGVIASNLLLIIPNATLYHLGILTSSVHMAWTRASCGRLEMRYRYSKDIVYNNFPWVDSSEAQKTEIGKLAQAVLDARALFPDSSLADLYDPLSMPPRLLKVHKALDRVVMGLYGFKRDATETDVVASLMERYRGLAGDKDRVWNI